MTLQSFKTIELYVKQFCYKCVQVIAQSRSGEDLNTLCNPSSSPVTWFNMAVGDDHKAQNSASAAISEKVIDLDNHLLVDVSLKCDNKYLLMETWSIEMCKHVEKSVKNQSTYYSAFTQLLRLLLCISRAIPAYHISRNITGYKIVYRVYRSKLDVQQLGRDYRKVHIGSVDTPLATIKLSVYYRPQESINLSSQNMTNTEVQQAALHPSFMSQTSSHVRPSYTTFSSRVRTISQTSDFDNSRLSYDTPPSVILYSSSGERRNSPQTNIMKQVEGSQHRSRLEFAATGSGYSGARFIVGTPPRYNTTSSPSITTCSSSHKQSPTINYSTQFGISPISNHSPKGVTAYGSPTSIDEEWVMSGEGTANKSLTPFSNELHDSKKKVVRVTAGFNTSANMTSHVEKERVLVGALTEKRRNHDDGKSPPKPCFHWFDRMYQDDDECREISEENVKSLCQDTCASTQEKSDKTEKTIKKSVKPTRSRQYDENNLINKFDLLFSKKRDSNTKSSFYQSTLHLINSVACYDSPEGHESLNQMRDELQEHARDCAEFESMISEKF